MKQNEGPRDCGSIGYFIAFVLCECGARAAFTLPLHFKPVLQGAGGRNVDADVTIETALKFHVEWVSRRRQTSVPWRAATNVSVWTTFAADRWGDEWRIGALEVVTGTALTRRVDWLARRRQTSVP